MRYEELKSKNWNFGALRVSNWLFMVDWCIDGNGNGNIVNIWWKW